MSAPIPIKLCKQVPLSRAMAPSTHTTYSTCTVPGQGSGGTCTSLAKVLLQVCLSGWAPMVGMGVQKGYYASHRCVEEGVQGL